MTTKTTCLDCIHKEVCKNKDNYEAILQYLTQNITGENLCSLKEDGFDIYVKCQNYSEPHIRPR